MRSVLVWFAIGLGFFLIAKGVLNSESPPKVEARAAATVGCDAASFPGHGAVQVVDASRMRRSDAVYSGLEIDNQHPNPVFAYLTEPDSDARLLGVAVAPGRKAQASVPVGRYGLLILSGARWCNEQEGFADGHRAKIRDGIEVPAGKTLVLALNGGAASAEQPFQLVASQRLPQTPDALSMAPETKGPGYVDLRQMPDGHYYVDAILNGASVKFLLDTGASLTSISPETASQAGLHACTQHTFQTANGAVQGCVTQVAEMTFGGFVVRNFEVVIMPNLGGKALLGMNVLGQFRMEQQHGLMRLAIR
jgi:clan AA aspartic protease (TIGR02281 family)